ncbi:MAG: hypothetical protein AB7O04_03530 [Hyphomonadaceae bacterium]
MKDGLKRASKACAALAALALGACGQGGPGGAGPGLADACAELADANAAFGQTMNAEAQQPLDTMAGVCRWESADGATYGEMIVFTPESTRNWAAQTPEAMVTREMEDWRKSTFASPQTLEGVGQHALLITDMPGGNALIAMRTETRVYYLMASAAAGGEESAAIARRMAAALAQ